MYNEPMLNQSSNNIMKIIIDEKIKNKIDELTNQSQSNEDLMKNLHDLCVLNSMADSHEKNKNRFVALKSI